ncbi:MAG: UDP-N-acetylglucosamine 1-carboxyvinyltransferase [Clostridiales bacterium]|nr:MAG: UDP-N-acetylglucosamine 1-carboxyvinyltransferase [Clostridiales bacterium]
MDKYIIRGKNKLLGDVTVSGAKNSAVAIIPATLLVEGKCIIENVPDINDTKHLLYILKNLGAKVDILDDTTVAIDCTGVNVSSVSDYEAVRKMRASYYLVGALLGRFGNAKVGMPGGCDFGVRPIDQHIKGFERLGAKVDIEHGIINAHSDRLVGSNVYFDGISVGATINVILAAVRAEGQTIIENPAKEPHVVDVANFLNAMGADIRGAGTDIIKIRGVKTLYGGNYAIIPDQIEAGTYMVAAAATGGKVNIKNVIPKHMDCISAKLREAGVIVDENDDCLTVYRDSRISKLNLKTLPYPGFPTDMQPQFTTMLCLAEGTSVVTEGIFDHRFKYVDELRRMGAKVDVDGRVCIVNGIDKFMGAAVKACDLRAGVALIIAGLCAEGITEISDIEYIERGYEDIIEKFRSLGANITKITDDTDSRSSEIKAV